MKKTTEEFYKEIGRLLKSEYALLFANFEKRITTDEPKDIFMWLDEELRDKAISEELDNLLTDFFYSIH